METVKMHGPSFDGSGQIVERDVPAADVRAYKVAGYVVGALPEELKPSKPAKVEKAVESVEVKEEAPKPKAKKK